MLRYWVILWGKKLKNKGCMWCLGIMGVLWVEMRPFVILSRRFVRRFGGQATAPFGPSKGRNVQEVANVKGDKFVSGSVILGVFGGGVMVGYVLKG
ncbi:MAG: hypothetical protein Hyperionvirus2_29 [Hyperionvirus sp.]|uniref:Uncharacterized protein n=1 Tax=Hyperionvirus sp. TaxID=2487770 RepID=A0A3G5A906_9VIRU|nr:MAG: hypothetical protein Hyperionvirus2_29 [Hyperionvirus sp.]